MSQEHLECPNLPRQSRYIENQKEPQFPNGRVFVCNTQDEWIIYRDFLRDRKQHELIGKSYLILLFGPSSLDTAEKFVNSFYYKMVSIFI